MTTTERDVEAKVEPTVVPEPPACDIPTEPLLDRARRWAQPRVKRARKACARGRYHTWRYIKMALKLMFWFSWRGLWRVIRKASAWVYDYDSASMRHEHAQNTDTKLYSQAQRDRRANLRARYMVIVTLSLPVLFPLMAWFAPVWLAWIVAFLTFIWVCKLIPGKEFWEFIVAAGVAGIVGWVGMTWYPRIPEPDWSNPLTITVLVVLVVGVQIGLGFIGRPENKPLIKNTVLGANTLPTPTAPMIKAALCALGNSKMKEPDQIDLIIDGARNGPGWSFHLLLPQGVTATWVMGKREELAGSMRFPLGTIWPSVGARNPAHLVLDVTDEDLKDAEQEPWPLLHAGRVDLSKHQPQGTNQKGDWVPVLLAYANVIIGAVPRVGKTYFLRQLLITAGLDPMAKVYAIDGKGTGDLSPCALFAHRYLRGVRSTRPELIEKVRAMVRELRHEMDRRSDIIDSLSYQECPDAKVTGELIKNRPDLKLGWIVVGIDETQMLFGYGDKENKDHKKIRNELRAGIEELVKLGPALGIIIVLATQDVVEETVPNQISRMAVIRFCMKVEDFNSNNRILGSGSSGRGITGEMFSQEDIGIGWLKAEGTTPQIVRTVWGLDKPKCEPLAARGRALRIAAGTLTGDAVGEEMDREEEQITLLEDVRYVFESDGALTLDEIRDGLALLREGIYGHLDNESLGGMLNEAGVKRGTVYSSRSKVKARGVKAEWLQVSATSDVTGDETLDDEEDDGGEVIQMPQR